MAIQLQLRKGTKVQNDAFTGAEGELTYDSTSKGLRLHDGVQQGGYIVDTVVAWQAPTAENNYTWYRKYSSGWVEQGGKITTSGNNDTTTLSVTMADTNYQTQITCQSLGNYFIFCEATSTTQITSRCKGSDGSAASGKTLSWQVSGMTAE